LAADKRADDRHRMVHCAEAADDDDVAILDKRGGLLLTHQHFLALRAVGACDRFKLHVASSRKTGVCSDGSAVTRLPIAGGSARLKCPSTRFPSVSSTSTSTKGAAAACALSGTRMIVWLCTLPSSVIGPPRECAPSPQLQCRLRCGSGPGGLSRSGWDARRAIASPPRRSARNRLPPLGDLSTEAPRLD